MSKTTQLLVTIALASVAIPASAGSWPSIPRQKAKAPATATTTARAPAANAATPDGFVEGVAESGAWLEQYRYFRNEENERPVIVVRAKRDAEARSLSANANAGYTFAPGEAGWQLNPHRLVVERGRLAHSSECDHAVRTARAPTPEELDAARLASPGA